MSSPRHALLEDVPPRKAAGVPVARPKPASLERTSFWKRHTRSSTTLAASPSSAVRSAGRGVATYMRAKLRLAADVPITQGDLAKLRSLDLNDHVYGGKERLVVVEEAIVDLSGMEFALNLARLVLQDNAIADLSMLSGLTTLQSLWLDGNKISDVSALAGLTSLADLRLSGNAISDISALSGLTRLGWLFLRDNNISDLSALPAHPMASSPACTTWCPKPTG